MKRLILLVLAAMLILAAFSAARAEEPQPVTEITLNESEITLQKGKSFTLKADVQPKEAKNKKVTWTSSDPAVATVGNGAVRAVSCGECEIVCEAQDGSGVSARCCVRVVQFVTALQAKDKKVTVPFGGTYTPEVTVKPEDATNPSIVWTSSDESVLTVDGTGAARAVGAGDCELTGTAADGSGKSVKISVHVPVFDVAESSWEVTETDGLVIPLDLHGTDLQYITCKAAKENFFMYWLDQEGLHILPLAAGSTTVTLASTLNKQDTAKFNITVAGSALYAKGAEPLRITVAPEKTFVKPGEKVKIKYYVSGGRQPYKNVKCVVTSENANGRSMSYPEIKKYPSGEVTAEIPIGYNLMYATITVTDADGNEFKADSSPVPIDHLTFIPGEEYFACRRGEQIEIPFRIVGGSGKYTLKYYAALIMPDGSRDETKEVSATVGSEGTIVLPDPGNAEYIQWYAGVWDQKNKSLAVAYDGSRASVTDDKAVSGHFDKREVNVGEEVTFYIRMEGSTPDDEITVCFWEYASDYEQVGLGPWDLKDEGNGVWSTALSPVKPGTLRFLINFTDSAATYHKLCVTVR